MGLVHGGWRYRPGVQTLPELLRPHGYRSALIGLQHEDLDSRVLGFDEVHGLGFLPRAMEVARRTEWWLARDDAVQPFFLSIGTWEAHRPWPAEDYEPADPDAVDVPAYLPDSPATRRDISQFHGAIHQLDQALGHIMRSLENSHYADNTLVLFTTDHGAAFPRAKSTVYDSGVQVAFLVRPPQSWGLPSGRRSTTVSHLDIAPSFIELGGGTVPEYLEGASFIPHLSDPAAAQTERELILEKTHHDRYDPIRAIRTSHAKYIRNFVPGPQLPLALDLEESPTRRGMENQLSPKPAEELYLLADDPAELDNLAAQPAHEELRGNLADRLYQHLRRTGDPILAGEITAPRVPARDNRGPVSVRRRGRETKLD